MTIVRIHSYNNGKSVVLIYCSVHDFLNRLKSVLGDILNLHLISSYY